LLLLGTQQEATWAIDCCYCCHRLLAAVAPAQGLALLLQLVPRMLLHVVACLLLEGCPLQRLLLLHLLLEQLFLPLLLLLLLVVVALEPASQHLLLLLLAAA
jgi:hypothetical protein